MKILYRWMCAAALGSLGFPASTLADIPEGKLVGPFHFLGFPSESGITGSPVPASTGLAMKASDDGQSLDLVYTGTQPVDVPLVDTPTSPYSPPASGIYSPYYAIAGEVSYENATSGTYLEMITFLSRPEQTPSNQQVQPLKNIRRSHANATSGPQAGISGTSSWRPFWILRDQSQEHPYLAGYQFWGIDFVAHFAGPGTIHLRGAQLVQYAYLPEAIPQPNPQEHVLAILSPRQSNAELKPVEGMPGVWRISSNASLWDLDTPPIAASKYAIMGEIRYDHLSPSRLELTSNFAPREPEGPAYSFLTEAYQATSPLGRFEGASDWRPFWLPFDREKQTSRLTSLVLNLHVADLSDPATQIMFRSVRLVEFPSNTFPASLVPTGEIPQPRQLVPRPAPSSDSTATSAVASPPFRFEAVSFVLGVVAAFVASAAIYAVLGLARRFRTQRHARELRRIASLDG